MLHILNVSDEPLIPAQAEPQADNLIPFFLMPSL